MNLPNLSPVQILGLTLVTDLAVGVVGAPKQLVPLVWGGAAAYSFVKGHPIWGSAFVLIGTLSYAGQQIMDARAATADPAGPNNPDTAVTGPSLIPSSLRNIQAVLSNNAKRSQRYGLR